MGKTISKKTDDADMMGKDRKEKSMGIREMVSIGALLLVVPWGRFYQKAKTKHPPMKPDEHPVMVDVKRGTDQFLKFLKAANDNSHLDQALKELDVLEGRFTIIHKNEQALELNVAKVEQLNKESEATSREAVKKTDKASSLLKAKKFTPNDLRKVINIMGPQSPILAAMLMNKRITYETKEGSRNFRIVKYKHVHHPEIFLAELNEWVTVQKHILDEKLAKAAVVQEEQRKHRKVELNDLLQYIKEHGSKPEHDVWDNMKGALIVNEFGQARFEQMDFKKHLVRFHEFPADVWVSADDSLRSKVALRESLKIAKHMKALDDKLRKGKPFDIESIGHMLKMGKDLSDKQIDDFPTFNKDMTAEDVKLFKLMKRLFVYHR